MLAEMVSLKGIWVPVIMVAVLLAVVVVAARAIWVSEGDNTTDTVKSDAEDGETETS